MAARIPNDIYQFSTVGALMGGLATSGPKPSQLSGYGTHGIGTFAKMDGELLYINGKAWQFTSDGTTKQAPDDISLPFIQVTKYEPELNTIIPARFGKDDLLRIFSSAGAEGGGKNSFIPFTVKGSFHNLYLRAAGPQQYDGQGLAEVAKNAKEWTLEEKKGTIFGIISPEWSQGISVAGVHCHFISEPDESGEVQGGHVKDFKAAEGAEVGWAVTGRFHLGLPRGEEWESLELGTVDNAGIAEAEGPGSK